MRNFTIFADDDDVHSVSNLDIVVCLLLLALVEKLVCKMDFIRGGQGGAVGAHSVGYNTNS